MDPKRKRCQSCQLEYWEAELARFGRHKGSPLFCKTCAEAEFERLRRSIKFEVVNTSKIVETKG